MFSLRSVGSGADQVCRLAEGNSLIGRGKDCAVRLQDPRSSRHHAEIRVAGQEVTVDDLGSRNGLFVNGTQVEHAVLHAGDEVTFGAARFIVEEVAGAAGEELSLTDDSTQIIERGSLDRTALPVDSDHLQVLHTIAEGLVSTLDLTAVLPKVLDIFQELFSYDRCAVIARDRDGSLRQLASRPQDVTKPFSRTIAERVYDRGETLLYDDVVGQAPFDLGQSVIGLNIRSVLCSPLVYKGQINGLIYLDRSVPGVYDMEDLSLLKGACALVAIAVENGRLFGELQHRCRMTEEELRRTEARLVEAERTAALGRVVLAVAHEVRNPVMVIGGFCRRLERHPEEAVGAGTVAIVRNEAERLEKMMERVEVLAALPSAEVHPVALGETLERAVSDVRPIFDQVKARLELPPAGELGCRVPHDPALTRIALAAVLEHACAGKSGGTRVQVSLEGGSGGCLLVVGSVAEASVEQTAPGAADTAAEPRPWTPDLVLALAQRAMEAQGGGVQLAERAGMGTVVEIWWSDGRAATG